MTVGAGACAVPAPRHAALSVEGISKHHGPVAALQDVSFTVAAGTVHGLVGGNGAGKSSLVRVLAGVSRADPGGTITLRGETVPATEVTPAWSASVGLRFVHQDLGVFPHLTVAENLLIGRGFPRTAIGSIRWAEARRYATSVLERFGIRVPATLTLSALKPADQTLVAIARALQDQSADSRKVVVLDEPTASLPVTEAQGLLRSIRLLAAEGHSIVLISHRLGEILGVADAVSVLRDGRLVRTVAKEDLNEACLLDLIAGDAAELRRSVRPPRQGRLATAPTVELQEVSSGTLRDVSFQAAAGEIVGVAGLLGSGRSRLLRAMFGAEKITSGRLLVEGCPIRLKDVGDAINAGFAYLPEDRAGEAVFTGMSLRENLTAGRVWPYWSRTHVSRRAESVGASELARKYLIRSSSVEQPILSLSGGNQQKAILARTLSTRPKILLMDEPTQGVDVHARAEIHALVREAVDGGSVAIVVSSDFEELALLCDRVLVLNRGHLVEEIHGDRITPARLQRGVFRTMEEVH